MATDLTAALSAFRTFWWLVAIFGLLNIVAGVILLVWPDISLVTLAVVTGLFLLVEGLFDIVGAIAAKGEQGRGLLALVGALSVIAGIVLVKHPFNTLVAFVIIFGVWLVVAAVLRFVAAVAEASERGTNILVGLLDLIAGVVILAWPELGLATAAVLAGIILIVRGIAFVWGGWQVRKIPAEAFGDAAPVA
jgi:uncharacterized membrane protein HdeD (DUF308 family)